MRTTFTAPALAFAVFAVVAAPRTLPAQLTFAPPAAPANVAGYKHVEECLAASARVRDSVQSWGGLWVDTLSVEEHRKPQASSAPARAAAQRCADGIPRGDRDLADFAPWFELHLSAGRDDRAEALLQRRLAAVAPAAIKERVAVLDSAATIALRGVPRRVALAERVLDLRDQHDSVLTAGSIYDATMNLVLAAQSLGDREAAVRGARRVVRLDERASPSTREKGRNRVYWLFMARTMIAMDSALAALRTQGTDAYVAIRRDAWAKASGGLPAAMALPIGEKAPEIQADVWLGDRKGDGPRPTKGRVALVVFVPMPCNEHCPKSFAVIRRIAERFPELEVTFVTATKGHVNPLLTPTVAEEAAVLRETLVAGQRLPGAVAVEDAHPWNLPAPDGRRIEMPTPNVEAYKFESEGLLVLQFGTFLVDRDGTIVEHQRIVTPLGILLAEEMMTTVISILLANQDGVAGGAR